MSKRMLDYVVAHSSVDGAEYTILLVLAHYANDDGACRISIRKLADLSRLSMFTVVNALRDFIYVDELEVVADKKPHAPCLFRILTPENRTGDKNVNQNLFTALAVQDTDDDLDDLSSLFG